MDEELTPAVRDAVIDHVLQKIYPSRHEAEVVDTKPVDSEQLVGVKVAPSGYISTAKYAIVTLDDDGTIVGAESCSGKTLRRELSDSEDED